MKEKKEEKKKSISRERYFEWLATVEQINNAKLEERIKLLERDLLNKDIECKRLRLALFKDPIEDAKKKIETTQADFQRLRLEIEKEIGMSLENVAINPHTLELNELK